MSQKVVILYERLSRDDNIDAESNSITNQKIILEEFCKDNGITNFKHITDDGVSGLRFDDRPGYVQIMNEIMADKVAAIVVKDFTRLGRDYARLGLCVELMQIKKVRFVALNDGIDTDQGEDDFFGMRAVMAEMYAKDTSRKIRSAYKAKSASGKPVTSYPPYGFLKSPEDKFKWIVDTEAAAVVRRIFHMTMEGKGPYQICCTLKDEKVPIPAYYLAQKGAGLHQRYDFPDPYNWYSTTVCGILKKKEYLGHTVNFKTRKHFKDKKSHYVDESEWTIIENTHEPIIDQVLFDNVQRIRGNIKRRPDGWGYTHPLSGLMWCADCGGKLYVHRIYNGKDKPTAVCGNYAKAYDKVSVATIKCKSGHRIDTATLTELIRDLLKAIADYAKTDKAGFIKSVQETLASQQTTEIKKQKKRLVACKKRHAELETLFKKIYEDNALGKLPDKRFDALANDYGKEQDALEKETAELEKSVGNYEDGSTRAKRFIELVNRYTDFTELTVPMLNEFVEKIVVHERDSKGKIESIQKVEIHLNFIGEYLPPTLTVEPPTPEDEEELRKVLERREKFRQNYLKRKASGKQQEYDRRYREKHNARIAANKASLFEDGAVLGAAALAPLPVAGN
jgi:DNA invertase Pin-like site-specific DNA recombinase